MTITTTATSLTRSVKGWRERHCSICTSLPPLSRLFSSSCITYNLLSAAAPQGSAQLVPCMPGVSVLPATPALKGFGSPLQSTHSFKSSFPSLAFPFLIYMTHLSFEQQCQHQCKMASPLLDLLHSQTHPLTTPPP